jgi:peptide/nickel transport system ATP-binding protein
MCDRVGVMKDGKLVEVAETEALFADPQHSYTRELLSLMPRLDGLSDEGLAVA